MLTVRSTFFESAGNGSCATASRIRSAARDLGFERVRHRTPIVNAGEFVKRSELRQQVVLELELGFKRRFAQVALHAGKEHRRVERLGYVVARAALERPDHAAGVIDPR